MSNVLDDGITRIRPNNILVILCVALAITCGALALELTRQPRFTHVQSTNPYSVYIMFDNKTAQDCWSGAPTPKVTPEKLPAGDIFDALADTNALHLPFCKDLK
jgi:hypothetical protein